MFVSILHICTLYAHVCILFSALSDRCAVSRELSAHMQDMQVLIEEQLDQALAKTCMRFHQTQYAKIWHAFGLLGKV